MHFVLIEGSTIPAEGYVIPAEGYVIPAEGYVIPAEGYVIPAHEPGSILYHSRQTDSGTNSVQVVRIC